MAHVAELPGCFATGRDASQAAGAVPAAIAGFLVWLRGHSEPLVPENPLADENRRLSILAERKGPAPARREADEEGPTVLPPDRVPDRTLPG